MTQEELIREVGKVIPNGVYSEEVIQLAFTMFTHGYEYAVEKACKWLQDNLYVLRTFKDPRVNKYEIFIRMLRGAMNE